MKKKILNKGTKFLVTWLKSFLYIISKYNVNNLIMIKKKKIEILTIYWLLIENIFYPSPGYLLYRFKFFVV